MARIAGLVFGSLLILGMVVAMVAEGVSMFRGWRNTDGTTVPGYGLYERQYSSPIIDEQLKRMMPPQVPHRPQRGWEFTEFYQWEMPCRFFAAISQRGWVSERTRILARPERTSEGHPLFTEADLPVERYRCFQMNMLYQAGMGWGLF